jgi:glutaredoxin 3
MKEVTLYSADWCPYCNRAKSLLDSKGVPYKEINVDEKPDAREKISQSTGMRTIPIIFIGDELVGGYTELKALKDNGQLDEKLK